MRGAWPSKTHRYNADVFLAGYFHSFFLGCRCSRQKKSNFDNLEKYEQAVNMYFIY